MQSNEVFEYLKDINLVWWQKYNFLHFIIMIIWWHIVLLIINFSSWFPLNAVTIHNVSSSLTDSKVRDRYLRLNDESYIRNELLQLQDAYMTAVQSRDQAKTMLAKQISQREIINWEMEHQKRKRRDYNTQIEKIERANAALQSNLPLIGEYITITTALMYMCWVV